MESLKTLTENTQLNEQTRTLSQNPQNSTTTIPREQHLALFAVINKSRMLNGWTTKTAQELDATIRTWAEVFNLYKIPWQHYDALYKRAFGVRINKASRGETVPDMDATLLCSCWTGANGLGFELERERVNAQKYLPDTAVSDCPRCFGSGMEVVPGKGARQCDHAQ